jgi:membrane protease YdiL (CAAX protease family)
LIGLPEGRKQPCWGLLEIVLVYCGVFIITTVVGSYSLHSWWLENQPLGRFYLVAMAQFLATIGLVLIFSVGTKKASWADLGLRPASMQELLKYGCGFGILLVLFMLAMSWPLSRLQPDIAPQLFETMLRNADNGYTFMILFFMGAVLAPAAEELFYRAMIYPFLRGALGPIWGIVLAGLVFGLAHWDLWRTIPLAVGGAVLCYIYEKTGSIFVPMVTHGVWNGVMSLLVLLKIQI